MAVDESKRTLLSYWWVLPVVGTAGAFGYMANYARRVTYDKSAPGPPNYQPGPRQAIARLGDFKGPYSFREFLYRKTPCLVMELPAPTPTSVTVGAAFCGLLAAVHPPGMSGQSGGGHRGAGPHLQLPR